MQVKRRIYRIFGVFIIVGIIGFFYYVAEYIHYPEHRRVKQLIVEHPEFIPSAQTIKISSAGMSNIVSDIYWLSAIQYIGSNAIGGEYKRYLFAMLDLITDLNPYFTYPYQIGQLLLPSYNERYENLSQTEIERNAREGVVLGEKGVHNTCDLTKVEAIKKEFDLSKLWTEEQYKNPCQDAYIPYYLAYIYYWSFHDGARASEAYRITSANTDSPSGSRIMAAIMQGKSGDRQKSILMFLSLAENIGGENMLECRKFSQELGGVLLQAFEQQLPMNGAFLRRIEDIRLSITRQIGDKETEKKDSMESCVDYLNKAVREMNLAYIENADIQYFQDTNLHAFSPEALYEGGYIDYVPKDFQEADENTGIIYYYNPETRFWDYKMGER